jgi:hypothetical protein
MHQGNIFSIVNHVTDLKNIHMSTPPSSHDGHAFSNKLLAPTFRPLGDFLNPALALLGQDLNKSPIG